MKKTIFLSLSLLLACPQNVFTGKIPIATFMILWSIANSRKIPNRFIQKRYKRDGYWVDSLACDAARCSLRYSPLYGMSYMTENCKTEPRKKEERTLYLFLADPNLFSSFLDLPKYHIEKMGGLFDYPGYIEIQGKSLPSKNRPLLFGRHWQDLQEDADYCNDNFCRNSCEDEPKIHDLCKKTNEYDACITRDFFDRKTIFDKFEFDLNKTYISAGYKDKKLTSFSIGIHSEEFRKANWKHRKKENSQKIIRKGKNKRTGKFRSGR